ncbi:MAG: cytochrome d ubiquinol oxidase subunit II, partial [Solirubrobacteraceae bacterium]
SVFSGFYLALFLVLASLIVRGVSFEFWGKVDSPRWRGGWEWALAISSGAAALLFGVAWADFIHGVPMNASHVVTAKLWDLLHPYALLGGLTTLTLFLAHGANFLALRTRGDVQERASRLARRITPISALVMVAFLVWTAADHSFSAPVTVAAVIAALAVAAVAPAQRRSSGVAFTVGVVTVLALMALLLTALYPNALPSTTSHANDLTLAAAASHPYTLTVMTVVAAIFVPIVLLYQGWTYWVFRHRLGRDDYEGPLTPVAVLEHRGNGREGDGGHGTGREGEGGHVERPGQPRPQTGPATPA